MSDALRVLVVGLGSMGLSHARAYDDLDGFALAGLCARTIGKRTDLPEAWSSVPRFSGFDEALASVRPDVVSINTYPDTHAQYALRAIEAAAHVFVEKPLAQTVADAQRVVDAAEGASKTASSDIDSHTKTSALRLHHAALDANNALVRADETFRMDDEPDHLALCRREQASLLAAIRDDLDLTDHMADAVNSLRIVLAADESIRSHQVVTL
jgi:hypothetical protein